MKQLKAVLIGAGNRRKAYTDKMLKTPEKYKIVAVAEPIENRRNYIKETHGVGDDGIVHTLYYYLNDEYTANAISGADISCENHLTAFAAEKSRLNGGMTVDVGEYIKEP